MAEEIPEEIEACASEEERFELNDANLQLFDRQQEARAETPERSKKSVGFRMAATTPRQQHHLSSSGGDEGEVKIPKRGSSRGSSCIEEANHQSTISMLGDLFPQQYKNPSDDTKLRISKITSSSSGSSPETAKPCPATAPVSKFLEEPPLEPVTTKKRRNQRDRKQTKAPETAVKEEVVAKEEEAGDAPEEAKAEEPGKGKKKMATIKEMKERGAIARPSDIEQAKKASKKQKEALAPVAVPRTQTPTGAQPLTEPLLPKPAARPKAKAGASKAQAPQPQPQQPKRKGAPVRPPAPQGPFFDEQAMSAFLA